MHRSIETRAWVVFAGLLLAAAAAALAWWTGFGRAESDYELRTQDAVSGLIEGSPVEFHGVEVGHVRQVRLLDARTVQVLLRVKQDTPVTTATVATISGRGLAARGFTGYVYVSLDDSGPAGAALARRAGERYARIPAAPVQTVNLDTSIHQLDDNVRVVVALLQQALDADTLRSLKASATHLEQLSGVLAAEQGRLRTTLRNMERASGQVAPLLRSGNAVADRLRDRVLPQVQDTLGQVDAAASTATGALQQAQVAGQALVPLAQSGQSVMRSVETQVLPQTRQGLARMNQLLSKLDETVDRVRDKPSLLLWGKVATVPGPGEPAWATSGQHAQQRVVPAPQVVVERSAGMQCGQTEQRVGQPAVQHDQRVEQTRVEPAQGRQAEPVEDRDRVTAR